MDGEEVVLEDVDWETHMPTFTAVVEGELIIAQMVERLPGGFRLKFMGNNFDVKVRSAAEQRLASHMLPKKTGRHFQAGACTDARAAHLACRQSGRQGRGRAGDLRPRGNEDAERAALGEEGRGEGGACQRG